MWGICPRRYLSVVVGIAVATAFFFVDDASTAHAQKSLSVKPLEGGTLIPLSTLKIGDQAMFSLADSVEARVAGYTISGPARALVGQAADTIYLAVTSGAIAIDSETADAGEVLLLEPLVRGYRIERFDAARLLGALTERVRANHPMLTSDLEDIAGTQWLAIFFGRYETTSFNVQNPGSPEFEDMRRGMVGGETIRGIRFGSVQDPGEVERLVVSAFVEALSAGNTERVAELLDPTPYGGQDLRAGNAARRLVAEDLVKARDWAATLTGPPAPTDDPGLWRVSGRPDVLVRLRPVTDFVFVQSVE